MKLNYKLQCVYTGILKVNLIPFKTFSIHVKTSSLLLVLTSYYICKILLLKKSCKFRRNSEIPPNSSCKLQLSCKKNNQIFPEIKVANLQENNSDIPWKKWTVNSRKKITILQKNIYYTISLDKYTHWKQATKCNSPENGCKTFQYFLRVLIFTKLRPCRYPENSINWNT